MEFSANVILSALDGLRIDDHFKNRVKLLRGISVLPQEGTQLNSDILYVCLLSDMLSHPAHGAGFFVCVRDRFLSVDAESGIKNTVIVNELDLGYVYNLLQSWFMRLTDWRFSMQQSLLAAPSYQTLMDLSEGVLNNAIYALDDAYALLAYTKNIESPDPINISLVEQGRHSDDTMEKLRTRHRFGDYIKTNGTYVAKAGDVSEFESLCRWIRFENEPCVQLVLVFCRTKRTAALTELFEMLAETFQQCLRQLYRINSPVLHPRDELVYDLLYNSLGGAHIAAERARAAGIAYRGFFNVFRILFADTTSVLIGRTMRKLRQILPEALIISKEYEITVLNSFKSEAEIRPESEKKLERIVQDLGSDGLICGVSMCFKTLERAADAASQATSAASFGEKLYKCGKYINVSDSIWRQFLNLDDRHCYFYDELCPYLVMHYYQLGHANRLYNAGIFSAVKRLIEYDRMKNSSLTELLVGYVMYERRATVIGRELHMHRNNVLYGISKINDMLGIDMESPMARYQLMSAFILLGVEATEEAEIGIPS